MADGINRLLTELLNRSTQPQASYDPMKVARPGPWITPLNPQQEQEFRAWLKAPGSEADPRRYFNPDDLKADYDMRGFWLALQRGDPEARTGIDPNDQRLHMTDRFKTPYHKTFSADSMYSLPGAPRWLGDRLIDSQSGRVLFDDRKR